MTEFKNVAVVGLGLIGGSMCKTITNRTERRVYGYNRTVKVCEDAKAEGAINGILEIDAPINEMDLFILCLYPDTCIEFVKTHLADIKKGAVIVDCCGTKRKICDALYELCKQNGVIFIGGHPMAGIEKSGYSYSFDGMFNNASMILCKLNNEENDSSKAGRKAGDKTENTEYRTSVSTDDYQASYNEAYASLKEGVTEQDLRDALEKQYRNEPFIRILPKGVCPETRWVEGSNYVDINVLVDKRTNRAILMGAIDNLVKGAAGQAVQNMNLMFGLSETAGLDLVPLFP